MIKNIATTNNKVLILVGIPASGKSTWSKQFVSDNENYVRLNRDDFRFMLKDKPMVSPKEENIISKLMITSSKEFLKSKYNIIIDNTNCKLSYINDFIKELTHLADIEFKVFDISIEDAIDRDNNRDKKVGKSVIAKFYKDLTELKNNFNFEPIIRSNNKLLPTNKIVINPELPNAFIFDIDGTLAHNVSNRNIYDYQRVIEDGLDSHVSYMLNHLKDNHKIIIVSGRDDSCKDVTIEWFKKHNLHYDHFHMRKYKDFRKDSIVKAEIYDNHIKDKFNILGVFDDRNQVVETWRSLGLKCYQVQEGDF